MSSRRHFLQQSVTAAMGLVGTQALAQVPRPEGENIVFGLCTYMWGAEWDVPTLIANLKKLDIAGVELRVDHAHKVSPALSPEQRATIAAQFTDGGIEVIGMGTNAQFDSPDEAKLLTNMDLAKQYIKLSHDIGGSGVKVKPNDLHEKEGVPKEKTLAQIAKCLAELGDFAIGFGQEIRLEVHGAVTNLQDIRTIMEAAAADNVRVCWNSNVQDIVDGGIEKSFALVENYLGKTVHIKEIDSGKYPYDVLARELVRVDYDGWVLCEANRKVEDKVAALGEQKALWEKLMAAARKPA